SVRLWGPCRLQVGRPLSCPPVCPCASLLDHLVRLIEKHRGYREAASLGSLQVDDQLKFPGLFHRQVLRLRPFEKAIDEGRHTVEAFAEVWAIRHQTAVAH